LKNQKVVVQMKKQRGGKTLKTGEGASRAKQKRTQRVLEEQMQRKKVGNKDLVELWICGP